MRKKISILLIVILFLSSLIIFDFQSLLSLSNIQKNLARWIDFSQEHHLLSIGIYLCIYILATAVSFPGATVLTLLGGALYGLWEGFLIVSFASTTGATLSFLGARYFLRESVEKRFPQQLKKINQGIQNDGVFYLFSLRLAPVVPFFVVNLLMGLTQMSTVHYFIVSQIGMIPGTLAYVYAGQELSQLTTLKGLLEPSFLMALFFLATVPWIAKIGLHLINIKRLYAGFQKPKKFDYNMIVIGGGAAGLVSSYIAAAVKAKVAIVEKHKMGGDCLNTGCVPSKALLKVARTAQQLRKSHHFGVTTSDLSIDFQKVMQKVKDVISEVEPHDSVERYTQLGVDCFQADAKIISPYQVEWDGKIHSTRSIVIATGAEPIIPKIPGLENHTFLTSETLWSLTELPKKLVIMGGGAIGCELAQAFQRLGSQVTLIEKNQSLISRGDTEASQILQARLVEEGVRLIFSAEVQQIKNYQVYFSIDGQIQAAEFDQLLFALGRKARVTGFGLENIGIPINSRGFIEHNDFLQTKYPNVYVCGDCAGPYQFTHMAAHQAWYASVNSLFTPFKKYQQDLKIVPSVIFTDPEVAQVGMTEQELKSKNIDFETSKYDISDLDRAICDGDNFGFIKILTAKGSDKILGATIVCAHAGELLAEIVMAMKHNVGLNKILSTIHAYPTWAEANKYVAGRWKSNHAPQFVLKGLKKFHAWRRG